ncbi:vanadium-dependent haloperoxidase [Massilia sp. CCM 9210]|uniref:vanadium-dependent haloperoxidase n=1 Tax=Massilia scottii TaxID=3057166 RepID=UPI0027966F24|nr:vanadium-dependent haloperoxidase [Massilia sp. CCM 9210]MDQ1813077.1 vanadium-dependent haloperoxidase [Massilia sp. CCM 9210]
MQPLFRRILCAVLTAALAWHVPAAPAQPDARPAAAPHGQPGADPAPHLAQLSSLGLALHVRQWSEAALRANALDHTPPPPGSARGYREQYGPARSARALAIYHLALYEALNAIARAYPSYTGMHPAPASSAPDAALARAARDTLMALYPAQAPTFELVYERSMARVQAGRARDNGAETGRRAAAAVLALYPPRTATYEDRTAGVDFFPSNAPGTWRPDPVSRDPLALGAVWQPVRPFVLPSALAFRPGPPPALAGSDYAAAFEEVRQLGGDGVTTPTRRTPAQTVAGIFWSYDGSPRIGAVPRLYNQIALEIGERRGLGGMQMARMLALVNVALADTCLTVWGAKYSEQFWRPVTGIREASAGSGPSGLGDGNPATRGDPQWTPLGAQASNTSDPDFTPPFPSYPSGHASLGSALFQTLRRFYGTDAIAFSFMSDEFNGITRDNNGQVRPRLVRSFASLSQAEEENGQSRIYLGVHWQFDRRAGSAVGRRVADYVFEHGLVAPDDQRSRQPAQ